MYTVSCKQIERTCHNNGAHAQQTIDFTLTGKIRKPDNIPYNVDSDIPEFHMSVKSNRATLVSGNLIHGDTKESILNEFFQKVASTLFAYVTSDFTTAYIMDSDEFRNFFQTFGTLTRDSQKNGGRVKVRLNHESKSMLEWLRGQV